MHSTFNQFNLEQFLQSREDRVEKQNSLLQHFKNTLLIVRANYPGMLKTKYPANEIVSVLTKEVNNIFLENIIFFEESISPEGFITTFIIKEDAEKVKEHTIFIEENHPLGRFVDIDVYYPSGQSLSRGSFGYPKRKCYLCEKDAVLCSRESTHSVESLVSHIMKAYETFLLIDTYRVKISEKVGELALKSCLLELSCHPSFGLVSPINSGSHSDMDYFTFLESSFAIKKGLTKMGEMAFSYLPISEIFKRSRSIGIETERDMFQATKGINTHKGMIFLLGISIISTCKSLYDFYFRDSDGDGNRINIADEWSTVALNVSIDNDILSKNISDNIKFCCFGILNDFDNIPLKKSQGLDLTNGEKLYVKFGFKGLRGEVANGLTLIFDKSLPFLEKEYMSGGDFNYSLVKTLLYLMSQVEDSTIVHRGGIETLKQVQQDARLALNSNLTITELYSLEKEYISQNISPGGSADLLGVTIFFHLLKKINWEKDFL